MPLLKLTFFIFFFSFLGNGKAQEDTLSFQYFIENEKNLTKLQIQKKTALKQFYRLRNYSICWLDNWYTKDRTVFLNDVQQAPYLGLQEQDYHLNLLKAMRNGSLLLSDKRDSFETELAFTDAALHFYSDLAHGNTKPVLSHSGLQDNFDCKDIPTKLSAYLNKQQLSFLLQDIMGTSDEVVKILKKINWLQPILMAKDFKETKPASYKIELSNKALLQRLFQLGMGRFRTMAVTEKEMIEQIKILQQQFNLLNDGKLRNTTIEEFNVPLSVRLKQLNLSVNYYRWLSCLTSGKDVIVVNIPSTQLKVYRDEKIQLSMRVIVGKKITPTPTLSSMLKEVVLYPYWHVPYSIATKELLPSIKRDPGYLDRGNYQVINQNGKVMDPYSINWRSLSTSYFPYIIRQSTGCDNALGLLKLNFENPFSVYLHDTPNKNLFMLNNRFFSHGCMRMEKPLEIGRFVLRENKIAIDTLTAKGCVHNQSPLFVPVKYKIPIIVWYNPVATNLNGDLVFFADIYDKFNWNK